MIPSFAKQNARLEAYLSTHAFRHLFTVFYAMAVALMFIWGFKGEYKFDQNGPIMRYYIGIARGAGYALNLNTALVILLAARTLLTAMRDTPLANILPLDTAFPDFHVIVGYVIGASVLIHASFHMVWITRWDGWAWGLWQINQSVITGYMLFLIFGLMFVFSLPRVRQNHFRFFHATHLFFATLFFIILILHGMFRFRPETYKYVTPTLIIYLFDRVYRKYRVRRTLAPVSLTRTSSPDNNVLKVQLLRPFPFRPGQYAELQVPAINLEWHPFSIASASHEEYMTFYIKELGDWTTKLRTMIDKSEEDGTDVYVHVRGPFGAPAQHARNYERLILISGGIGATPFSSIVKDLHYRNMKRNIIEDDHTIASQILAQGHEGRIRAAIQALYDVDIGDDKVEPDGIAQNRSVFLTNMLQLTAGRTGEAESPELEEEETYEEGAIAEKDAGGESSSDSAVEMTDLTDSPEEDEDEDETSNGREYSPQKVQHLRKGRSYKSEAAAVEDVSIHGLIQRPYRQRILGIYQSRARLLDFLHSTRWNFLLVMVLILRILFICIGSIWDSEYVLLSEDSDTLQSRIWVVIIDTVLSVFLAIVLPLLIALEISFMGTRFFRTLSRCVDFTAFMPLTILSAAFSIKTLATKNPEHEIVAFVQFVVFIPVLFILLCVRMYRSIGSGRLLADRKCRCELHCKVPEVDFIWTVPHEADDEWLRDELEPLANGTELRLHRFVTRSKEVDMEAQPNYVSTVSAGRPDWDDLFRNVALSAPSNSRVGVFFCGPHKMGDAIQKALRGAEINSALRGAYLGATREDVLAHDLGLRKRSVLKAIRERGCSVRFVFREENFG